VRAATQVGTGFRQTRGIDHEQLLPGGDHGTPPPMKLVTVATDAGLRAGVIVNQRIVDLLAAFLWHDRTSTPEATEASVSAKYGADVLGFIRHSDVARPVADAIVAAASRGELPAEVFFADDLDHAKLVSPIPVPPAMRDGYAFRQHVEAARRNRGVEMIPEFDNFPVFYFTNHHAVIGGGDLPVRPLQRERLDYELEVAIVIGKEGRDLTTQNADGHVFGLLVMNDWSARAVQMEEMKLSLGPAKGKDFATGLGPYLVTLDELADKRTRTDHGDQYDLTMRAWVNGKLLSEGNVRDMTWTFAQILERVSYGVTVHPGEVIGSGTVGTGCLLELNGSKITQNQWLQPGDIVELEVERLGRLTNRIVAVP
jgi:fumarylacetoacetate (FAA) hydrolase